MNLNKTGPQPKKTPFNSSSSLNSQKKENTNTHKLAAFRRTLFCARMERHAMRAVNREGLACNAP